MTVLAHIAGLPLEETILGFAPAGFAFAAALHMTRERARQSIARLRRTPARARNE